MRGLRLDAPVQYLKGVGERRAELLARIGVRTVRDLLFHVPFRYLDATEITPIARARDARVGTEVTVVGRVVSTGVIPTRRGLRVFQAVLQDASGLIECGWPGRPFLERQITKGLLLLVTGPVRHFHGKQLQPREFVVLALEDEAPRGKVLPVYRVTEGITVRQLRSLIEQHLDGLLASLDDELPAAWRSAAGVPDLRTSLAAVHRPESLAEAEAGRRRLAFEELLLFQLVLARARWLAKRSRAGIPFEVRREFTTGLRRHLPFELTAAQKRCIREIVADQTAPERMHRLLQGDVGSGKTVVALFAMLVAVENGYQAALMAPTELLAEQHAATLARLLAPLGMTPELLVGRLSASEKALVRERLESGGAPLVVGTHALIQEGVAFRRLGLVVIDEQHRFGVEQRALLAEKNTGPAPAPDVLLLSATPIPRTLALALYGDLDVSRLDEPPPGRKPVRTAIRGERSRARVFDFVRREVGRGHQTYFVYPVIDETEALDLKAATRMADYLAKEIFPDLQVGLVHGRIPADERDRTMRRFRGGEIDVLVATTVIEVGIDVPNATVMVIEHPERFGLAQLHQLRGRIGRGGDASHCILMVEEGASRERLERFAATQDGFAIAELDLRERGQGELVGARQAGAVEFRYADWSRDADLLSLAHRLARDVIAADPALRSPGLRPVVAQIGRRFEKGLALFRA